jgi:hypothetical protein
VTTEPHVQQVRYRWSAQSLLGERGMGPVESTLGEAELRGWDRLLRGHVWAVDPTPGYICVSWAGRVALIRKWTTDAAEGRTGSAADALLSPALTTVVALGLTGWDGWATVAHEPLEPLDWSVVLAGARRGLELVRRRARQLDPERLAGQFGQWLTAPQAAYTIVGEPDPAAVICALGEIVGQIPAFATDERDDLGAELPAAVFLREVPASATAATRRRLTATPPDDALLTDFAAAAIAAYRADGVAGVAGIRPGQAPATPAAAREWANAAQFTPGVLADLTRLPQLGPAILGHLAKAKNLERVRFAAWAASPTVLARSLHPGLPAPIVDVLIEASLDRLARGSLEEPLLAALRPFRLSRQTIAAHLPPRLDLVSHVSSRLLDPHERLALITDTARQVALPEVLRWIETHAETDPETAFAGLRGVAAQLRRPTADVLRVVAERTMFLDLLRRLSDSNEALSDNLAHLLAALPPRALDGHLVAVLCAGDDPILLHALDRVVTDRRLREYIHERALRLLYRSHHLGEPTAVPASAEPDTPGAQLRALFGIFTPSAGSRRGPNDD